MFEFEKIPIYLFLLTTIEPSPFDVKTQGYRSIGEISAKTSLYILYINVRVKPRHSCMYFEHQHERIASPCNYNNPTGVCL